MDCIGFGEDGCEAGRCVAFSAGLGLCSGRALDAESSALVVLAEVAGA